MFIQQIIFLQKLLRLKNLHFITIPSSSLKQDHFTDERIVP